jgi:hypothetical protein
MLMWQRYTNNELMTSSFEPSMDYHYEKLCPPQAHCFATRAPKTTNIQLHYNYLLEIQGFNFFKCNVRKSKSCIVIVS